MHVVHHSDTLEPNIEMNMFFILNFMEWSNQREVMLVVFFKFNINGYVAVTDQYVDIDYTYYLCTV